MSRRTFLPAQHERGPGITLLAFFALSACTASDGNETLNKSSETEVSKTLSASVSEECPGWDETLVLRPLPEGVVLTLREHDNYDITVAECVVKALHAAGQTKIAFISEPPRPQEN